MILARMPRKIRTGDGSVWANCQNHFIAQHCRYDVYFWAFVSKSPRKLASVRSADSTNYQF